MCVGGSGVNSIHRWNAGSCKLGVEQGWLCPTRDFPHLAKVSGTIIRVDPEVANPLFRDNGGSSWGGV